MFGMMCVGLLASVPYSGYAAERVPFAPSKPLNSGKWFLARDLIDPVFKGRLHGLVGYVFHVSPEGKVTHCTVLQSSGDDRIDAKICDLVVQRAKFRPAGNPEGQPVQGTYSTRLYW
ncbi:TonB family protein [Erythrobacter sp. SG61-1L]|uniref:TonB family protein n=1 Tax=Erythrobacter sp. SG61-1L TaxID=1603897 RepID=UPI00138F792A|nr:TonB family protein [Erythrobacter sp. SG61-1L]